MENRKNFTGKYEFYAALAFFISALIFYMRIEFGLLLMLFTFLVFSAVTFITFMADIKSPDKKNGLSFTSFLAKNLVTVSVIFVASHWPGRTEIIIFSFVLSLLFVLLAQKNKNYSADIKKVLAYVVFSAVINYLFINSIQIF